MPLPPETSDSLLIRVRDANDRAAWDRFVAIYRPMTYRIARRNGLQDSDAEDVAQKVMMLVAKAIPEWERDPQRGGFRNWLNRVAVNALVSMLRSGRGYIVIGGSDFLEQSHSVEAPSEEIQQIINQEHHRSQLRWAAEQIRDEFQQQSWDAFWMTTLGGESVEEAAEKLSTSTGAVYAARSRIMRRLRQSAAGEAQLTDLPNEEGSHQ